MTAAPAPPVVFTEEESEILRRLDPDLQQDCEKKDCCAPATHLVVHTLCGRGSRLCDTHLVQIRCEIAVLAAVHMPCICRYCGDRFCSHHVPDRTAVTPIGGD